MRIEILVIGSGPGGLLAATLLAENGCDVILLEKGVLKVEDVEPYSKEELQSLYNQSGVSVALGNPRVVFAEGCCVGGGSEINSGLYHRLPESVFEEWQQHYEIQGYNYDSLKNHFQAVEKDLSVSFLPYPASDASLKLKDGAEKLNWNVREIPRWVKYTKLSETEFQSEKQTMSEVYLSRFLKAGGKLFSETEATLIDRQDSSNFWKVSIRTENQELMTQGVKDIHAKYIFVAGGSVFSPTLLLKSSLGQNIGKSLRMHVTAKVTAEFSEKVNYKGMGVPVHQVKEFSPKFSFGGSISSLPFLAVSLIDYPEILAKIEGLWEHMAVYYAMASVGVGNIRIIPKVAKPIVTYKLNSGELRQISEATRLLSKLLFAAGAKRLMPVQPNASVINNPDELYKLPNKLDAKNANLMTIHLMGSCPSGENMDKCAVNSFGKLHGESSIYVCDASILCASTTVNPQGSIMAMVRNNVHAFLEDTVRKR